MQVLLAALIVVMTVRRAEKSLKVFAIVMVIDVQIDIQIELVM